MVIKHLNDRFPRSGRRRAALPGLLAALLLPLLLHPPAAAQPSKTIGVRGFQERLEALLADSLLARSTVGISIVRAGDGSTIAAVGDGKLFHPASTMKVLTSAAALALLPPDFAFRTAVYAPPAGDEGLLRGDLVVIGGGDPLLDSADVDSLAGIVAAAGIRRIAGDLTGDLGLFDTSAWGKGWMWDDEPDPTAPFVGPLVVNGGEVRVTVGPGRRPGDPLEVAWGPAPSAFTLENVSSTIPRGPGDSAIVTRIRGEDRIVVAGAMALGARPETRTLSVRRPALHVLHLLRERLAARGIEVGGSVRIIAGKEIAAMRGGGIATGGSDSDPAAGAVGRGGAPRPPLLFLGEIARPLRPVLRNVNAKSDNLAAECLLRAIGIRSSGAPGTAESGLRALKEYLASAGIDTGRIIAADGSGVSWYNAVSPGDLTAVLVDQYARRATYGSFRESLARPGREGTLEGRLAGSRAADRIAAKTGTLTGVSTLSGYLVTIGGEDLVFSIMINHFPGPVRRLRGWQDALLDEMVRLDPSREE